MLTSPVLSPTAAWPAAELPVAMSEVLAALSRALDLTEGQPEGHSIRACVVGMRLGEAAGLTEAQRGDLYYALLLKDAGCSSNASRMAALFGSDDRAVKPSMKTVDWDDRARLAIETWNNTGRSASMVSRLRYFIGIAQQENLTRDLIAARCERGADIARRLGFPAATVEAIRSLDEHWNGGGYPDGLRGDAIPLLSRVVNLAQTIEVFVARDGVDGTRTMLNARRGRWFDPHLTDLSLELLRDTALMTQLRHVTLDDSVLSLEPGAVRRVDEQGLDEVAAAFADIIDTKSPFTFRHSSNVAMYAQALGAQLGLDLMAQTRLRRAGLLHDLGKVGISNRVLDKNGPLDATERYAVELHPVYTWEILKRVRAFADFARPAASHHEKLDGSGYPWKLGGDDLDASARILVVADIYEALTASRPYRNGMSPEAALAIMENDRGRRLDGWVLDALAAIVIASARHPAGRGL
jgi:HD-GYP domain-containing protein (c-di-GMP phosphodiesterase class II)